MKVTVSVPGKFEPAFQWARWLESRGELDRIVSPLPHGRTEEFGVTRARTRSLTPIGGWNVAERRWGRPIGLVVGDQHLAVRDRQPVDLAGDGIGRQP